MYCTASSLFRVHSKKKLTLSHVNLTGRSRLDILQRLMQSASQYNHVPNFLYYIIYFVVISDLYFRQVFFQNIFKSIL